MSIKVSNIIVVDDTKNLTNINSATFIGNSAITIPAGTTGERPIGTPGMIRYNSTDGSFEGYTTDWGAIGGDGGGYSNVRVITANTSANVEELYIFNDIVELELPFFPSNNDIIGVSSLNSSSKIKKKPNLTNLYYKYLSPRYFIIGNTIDTPNTNNLIVSNDFQSWDVKNSSFANSINDIATNGSTTVIVGNSYIIKTTTNFINWTTGISELSGANIIRKITAGSVGYILGMWSSPSFYYYKSSDGGFNWSSAGISSPPSATSTLSVLKYLNNLYIAAGNIAGNMSSSTNFVNWNTSTTGLATYIYDLSYGNGVYVAGGLTNKVAYSTNLLNWSLTGAISGVSLINNLVYGNGVYVLSAIGTSGYIYSSTNITNWTLRSTTTIESGVEFANGIFSHVTKNRLNYSTNAINWQYKENSLKILGLEEDLNITTANVGFDLVYTGNTKGWVVL